MVIANFVVISDLFRTFGLIIQDIGTIAYKGFIVEDLRAFVMTVWH